MITHPSIFAAFTQRVLGRLQLSQEALAPLKKYTRLKTIPKKSILVHNGTSWNRLYFIYTGVIRMYYIDPEGREFNKAFFGDKSCIWPVAPIDRNEGILFNIGVIPETTVLEVDFFPLQALLMQHGSWEAFALPFAERLVENKFQREHDFLLLSAVERYEKMLKTYAPLLDRIPDYHLASYLGITNVSLSRLKKSQLV